MSGHPETYAKSKNPIAIAVPNDRQIYLITVPQD